MNKKMRYLPLGVLPYESVEPATRMMVKLFEKIPYCPFLSKITKDETLLTATLRKIPGISVTDKNISFNPTSATYNQALAKLDKENCTGIICSNDREFYEKGAQPNNSPEKHKLKPN